jgi:hypothetical protein
MGEPETDILQLLRSVLQQRNQFAPKEGLELSFGRWIGRPACGGPGKESVPSKMLKIVVPSSISRRARSLSGAPANGGCRDQHSPFVGAICIFTAGRSYDNPHEN